MTLYTTTHPRVKNESAVDVSLPGQKISLQCVL